jgi:5-methylcytosine-specific restriction protein A
MLIVDMESGSYLKTRTGHEALNLIPNSVDGRYYGYCPPYGNIDIRNLGAKKDDESVAGITVVYVKKMKGSSNREVTAFCENATVHHKGQKDPKLKRKIPGEAGDISYSIESDTLADLTSFEPKFVIPIYDYSKNLFRMQRIFGAKYPDLAQKIYDYIDRYKGALAADDDFVYQKEIQEGELPKRGKTVDNSMNAPGETSTGGTRVNKDIRSAKQALWHAEYRCAADASHVTFKTTRGVPYMEGHHLIPCTSDNQMFFWKERHSNIDCENNIVCLCPTCHRRIHYGADEERRELIRQLYELQLAKLRAVHLDVSLEELYRLYGL